MNDGDESYDVIESLIDETLGYGTIRPSVLIYRLVRVPKLYGTFNTQDPAYINKQAAGFLRNIVSFASMGKVVFTAQADMGRPIMVHGFGRVYSQAWRPMMKNPELFKKIAKDAEFINPLIELTQQMSAAERYYGANMGPQNATGGFFNKYFYVFRIV